MKTKVIFRKWPGGDVIALFPELPGTNDWHTCLSYEHVGQHGAADMLIVHRTRRALPAEYAELAAELARIGYDLVVGRRCTKYDDAKRRAALDAMKIPGPPAAAVGAP